MTIQLFDQSGNVTANGTFTFIGNELKASYCNRRMIIQSILGSFMPESNKLVGTWGDGTNMSNGGRWVTIKK